MNSSLKMLICFFVMLLFFFSFNIKVNASSISNGLESNVRVFVPLVDEECEGILGDTDKSSDPAYWLQWILNAMKYVAIIALFVLVTMDFIKAIVANDKDAIKKAGSTAVKRFIYCVILFFLPIIVEFLMSLFGVYGTCGVR